MNELIKIIVAESSFRRCELWTTKDSDMVTINTFEIIPGFEDVKTIASIERMSKQSLANIGKAYQKYLKIVNSTKNKGTKLGIN